MVSYTKSAGGFELGGWNLLANPFPCEIDWNAVREDADNNDPNTSDNTIHIYKGTTGGYGSYTATKPSAGIWVVGVGRYIASS